MTRSAPPADPDPAHWTVTPTGAVADSRTMRASDLAALATTSVEASAGCEGEATTPDRWRARRDDPRPGTSPPRRLARAGSLGRPRFRLRDAFLAVRLGGDQIPTDRGGPVRLLVDDADCWEHVKWVSCIDVLDEPPGDADTAREQVPADG